MLRLVKRRGDDHALLRRVRQGDNALDHVSVQEVFHVEAQPARAVLMIKRQRIAAARDLAHALGGAFRQTGLSERQQAHRAFCPLPLPVKIEEGDRVEAHIAVVRDGERQTDVTVGDKIVVPLLDAELSGADVRAAVDRQRR